MTTLTDEKLGRLPPEVRRSYRNLWLLRDPDTRNTVEWLYGEFAKALTPLPCGHPRGCVVSVPYIVDVATANGCGWCAAQAENRRFVETGAKAVASWATENDALREKLAAADETRNLLLKLLGTLENEDGITFDNMCERLNVPREFLIEIGSIYDESSDGL